MDAAARGARLEVAASTVCDVPLGGVLLGDVLLDVLLGPVMTVAAVTSPRVRGPAPRAEIQGTRRPTRARVCCRTAGVVLVSDLSLDACARDLAFDAAFDFVRVPPAAIFSARGAGWRPAVVDVPDAASRRARRSGGADVVPHVRELARLRVIGPSEAGTHRKRS